jgi:RNA polymerase subunit RPABC4/transcription elongation factor Spt4
VGSQVSIHNVVLLLWGLLGLAWAVSVVWVVRDVRRRIWRLPSQVLATMLPLVLPGFGLLVYLALRPRTTLEERYAHSLWLELAEQTRSVERCPTCRAAVEPGFVACPICATALRQRCSRCEAALEADWLFCPYCETPVAGAELEPTRRGAADDQLPGPAAPPAPVAAPAANGKRRRSAEPRVEPVPKRAA